MSQPHTNSSPPVRVCGGSGSFAEVSECLALVSEAARLVQRSLPMHALLQELSELIGAGLGFGTVAINLYRPAWDDLEVVAVHGNPRARCELLGTTSSHESWSNLLDERFLHRGVFVIEKGQLAWDRVEVAAFLPPAHAATGLPTAWDREDALLVPLRSGDGRLLAVVSVDEPLSGLRPSDEALALLSMVAIHGSIAIETAQDLAMRESDRRALERLSRVSPLLTARLSVEATLHAVCEELRLALGFERVAVELYDAAGRFRPAASAGWVRGDPELDVALSVEEFDRLLELYGTAEDCVLATNEEAHLVVGDRVPSPFNSQLNGRGPFAWQRHWLLVPLRASDGRLSGFIWVDDPLDRLVPTRERLQALRLFGDQVSTMLTLAEQFDEIARATGSRRSLISAAPIAIIELDRDRVVRSWNPAAERIFGWRAQEVIGRRNPLIPDTEWDDHLARTQEVLDDGRSIDAVRNRLRADGTLVDVRIHCAPITEMDGETSGMLVLAEDITERVRAEEELRKTQEIHRRVVENSTDIISLIAQDGTVVFSNAASALGYADSDDPRWFAERIHPEDRHAAQTAIARALGGAAPTTDEVRVRHSDGSWRILEGVAVSIRDDEGSPELAMTITRDVTERRQFEAERAHAGRLESVGRLTAGVAHNFNNLLMVIGGYAEVARAKLADDQAGARSALDDVETATRQAVRLTRQLLAFSRQQVLRPELLDLNEIVRETTAMLDHSLGKTHELRVTLDSQLGACAADRSQIEQALVNLALNARDAMPSGGSLTIATANVELDERLAAMHAGAHAGPHVMLSVSDTGEGMDEPTLTRIFEPFFTTKPSGTGHGLGLASVHGIVNQSGGYLSVDSTPGEGSTFRIYLPRGQSQIQGVVQAMDGARGGRE
jgi:PAS domain S-box-containing protein